MSKFNLTEIDCVFISYDEPNADKNYADLLTKAPWAKRVHGVKGSDSAHKAAARLSETERFITVDADNIVDPNFFSTELEETGKQYSWCGKNYINNLVYGNGGLKCWTKSYVLDMKTHENADSENAQVDFCWDTNYQQMANLYSVSYVNASPLQAWRAGFREGVKMTLNQGIRQRLDNPAKQLPKRNYQRLLVWQSIGADVTNGLWAMYGARLGCYMTNCTDWDYRQVKDFDYLNDLFKEHEGKEEIDIVDQTKDLGNILRLKLNLPVADFDDEQSRFFKTVWSNPPRFNSMVKELDTSWDELEL